MDLSPAFRHCSYLQIETTCLPLSYTLLLRMNGSFWDDQHMYTCMSHVGFQVSIKLFRKETPNCMGVEIVKNTQQERKLDLLARSL